MATEENTMDILRELEQIFQDIFDDPSLSLERETEMSDMAEWNSLAQIRLVVKIEKRFNLKIAPEDWAGIRNVGDMENLIQAKTGS